MIFNEKMIIFKIQQIIALVGIMIGILAIITNFFIPIYSYEKIINIISVFLITAVFSITYFINNKSIRLFQALLIVAIGILTILLERRIKIAGDVFFIIGTILLYTYHFIKKFRLFHAFIMFALLGVLKFINSSISDTVLFSQNFYSTLFSLILIIIPVIIKEFFNSYIESTRLNNALYRISVNVGSLLLDFNFHDLVMKIYNLFPAEKLENADQKLVKQIYDIGDLVEDKDRYRNQLLSAIKLNGFTELLQIDISETINDILILQQVNVRVHKFITFYTELAKNLYIRAVPSEIYFMLQNLLTPLIEAMLKTKQIYVLSLFTKEERCWAVITIDSTGPGYAAVPPQKDKIFDFTPVWCKGIEYLRLVYARDIIYTNKGTIEFCSKPEGGVRVCIKLPVFVPEPEENTEWLNKIISKTLL